MENTKMSGKLAHNMTLTVEDQKWLKLLADRQDDVNLANSLNVIKTVKEMLDRQTEKIDIKFDNINRRLNEIKDNLNDKEVRLVYLEKYASWQHTVARHSIAICVGVLIGWFLHTALA